MDASGHLLRGVQGNPVSTVLTTVVGPGVDDNRHPVLYA
jgi:hypothetical protein